MDLEILKERDMPLMSRKRYTAFATFKGATPTRADIRDALSKKVKSDPELTVIKHIYNRYGIEKAKVIAHAYSKKEDLIRYEDKSLLDKHAAKKEESPKAKSAEEAKPAKEEAPKAKATEETKPEAAKEPAKEE